MDINSGGRAHPSGSIMVVGVVNCILQLAISDSV